MFLTPEEKISYLRKKYNITQNELSSTEIKRQFIGMIEIGKRSLTKNTAEIISKNFNEILKKRKVEEKITVSYLLETKEEQALKRLYQILENPNVRNDIEIEICFLELKDLKRKEFSFLLGEFYFDLKEIKLSKKYFEIALYLYKSLEKIEILLYLTRIYYYLNQFKKTVDLIENHVFSFIKNPTDNNLKILYNYGYSLYKIDKIEKSVEILKKLSKLCEIEDLNFKIQNILAVIYYLKLNKYKQAIKIYQNIFTNSTQENQLVIYGNYLEMWLSLKKEIKIEKVIEDVQTFLKNYQTSPDHLFKIYILIGKSYITLNLEKEAYIYYIKALNILNNKLTQIENKYEILLEILNLQSLQEEEIDVIIKNFFILFKEKQDYKIAIKFIKKIKSETKKLQILEKLN
ncbi:hypothetical protein [Candidatus Cetobacterium colombiensis]|nr:hypothetical protein [Candidatus Cetobacterium colombiensis]